MALALKTGNTKNVAELFAPNLNLCIKKEDGVVTKFQAKLMLDSFLKRHKVTELKQLQRVNGTTSRFVVFSLKTEGHKYRAFVKFDKTEDGYIISEMRIE